MFEDEDMEEIRAIFVDECVENLDIMENGLLRLTEGDTDLELVNEIFRAAHSIKGGGGTFGFMEITDFTHGAETLLDQVRSNKREITAALVSLQLETVDVLRGMMDSLTAGEDLMNDRVRSVQGKIEAMLNESDEAPSAPPADTTESSAEAEKTESAEDTGKEDEDEDEDEPPSPLSAIEQAEEAESKSSAEALATAKANASQKNNAAAEKPTSDKKKSSGETGTIKVSIDKIDSILDLIGEIVITQSMLGRFQKEYSEENLEELKDCLTQLESHTRELQDRAMKIRMLPIKVAFQRFPRLIRDLSTKLNKRINLEIEGGETELDKIVLEKITDPLVHLVRNALDHGIEDIDTRIAKGKTPDGTLKLCAYHESGSIVIDIIDDGAGINKDRVLGKAIERGIVSPEDSLSDSEIFNLIFMPGFSTAAVVSDISGRGVGMDVVRRNIQDLGGRIKITSELNKGSTFTIRLPLTLAILDGQLAKVGGQTLVIPLQAITETVVINNDNVSSINNESHVYNLRNSYVPMYDLRNLCDEYVGKMTLDKDNYNGRLLVVVESNSSYYGLVVDELSDQQQVVIKALESNYLQVNGLSGATILGDGTVSLILDVPSMMAKAFGNTGLLNNEAPA